MNHIVAPTNGATALASEWLQQSVQQFFKAINWDDQPPEIQHLRLKTAPEEAQTLNLFLTVSQFFSTFNWEGSTVAAPLKPSGESVPEAKDEFTLNDFSDLF